MKRADATSISGYVMGVVIPVRILLDPLARSFSRWISSQAAQDGAAGRVILAELFERIGYFFARLETDSEVAPTAAMAEIITKVMVEVLKIFAIVTKGVETWVSKVSFCFY